MPGPDLLARLYDPKPDIVNRSFEMNDIERKD